MMPDECASKRSMARWVLPVLVGPRTALTRDSKPDMRRCLGLGAWIASDALFLVVSGAHRRRLDPRQDRRPPVVAFEDFFALRSATTSSKRDRSKRTLP